jgi:hypothetical protein
MKLVNGWHRVLLRSYALWCVYLAGALDILPYVVPYVSDFIPNWASVALLMLSPVARIIQQQALSGESDNAGK